MKLIRRLLGTKSEKYGYEKDPQKKRPGLDNLSQQALEAVVLGATGDPTDTAIRIEALQKLPCTPAVIELIRAEGSQPLKLVKAAERHLALMLDNGNLQLSELARQLPEPEKLLMVVSFCRSEQAQQTVLNRISDEKVLATLCATVDSVRVRQALVERIGSESLLKELEHTLKARDKTAYKMIKAKLDHLHQQQQAAESLTHTIDKLCCDMEQHARRAVDKEFSLKLNLITQRWQAVVQNASEQQRLRFNTALSHCEEALKQELAQKLLADEYQAKCQAAQDNRHKIIATQRRFLNEVYDLTAMDAVVLSEMHSKLTEIRSLWQAQQNYGDIQKQQQNDYSRLDNSIEFVLHEYDKKGSLRECYERLAGNGNEQNRAADEQYLRHLLEPLALLRGLQPGAGLQKAQDLLRQIDQERKHQSTAHNKHLQFIGGLIRKANTALHEGRLKQAIGIRHSIEEKIAKADKLHEHFSHQLEKLDAEIKQMVDWQAYAVVPKKEALIAAMEELVNSDMSAEALANKIKTLHDDWKHLGQSGDERREDLWEKFRNAADRAYEPCKAYFEQQADLRKENLLKRQELVQQLRIYEQGYDWSHADWKQVDKILRNARNEFYGYTPVDRNTNKPVQTEFEELMAVIAEKLGNEYQQNKIKKQEIIAQAKELVQMEDLSQAAIGIKQLQTQWKEIGLCTYKDSERLWKEFRRHCDAVFTKKEQADSERKLQQNEKLRQMQNLTHELQALMDLDGQAFVDSRAERDRLREAFNELLKQPNQKWRGAEKNFKQALDYYDRKLTKEKNSAELLVWEQLFKLCERVNQYQWLLLQNPDGIDVETNKQKLISELEALVPGARMDHAKAILRRRIEMKPAGNRDRSAEKLRLLCIRAEIAADAESPAADKELRMAYQVQRLQQGMGHHTDSPDKLLHEWLSEEVVEEEIYAALTPRFLKGLTYRWGQSH